LAKSTTAEGRREDSGRKARGKGKSKIIIKYDGDWIGLICFDWIR
jgi:hypothetical protein